MIGTSLRCWALADQIIVVSREKHLSVSARPPPPLFPDTLSVEACFRWCFLQSESLRDHSEAQGQPTWPKQVLCCATLRWGVVSSLQLDMAHLDWRFVKLLIRCATPAFSSPLPTLIPSQEETALYSGYLMETLPLQATGNFLLTKRLFFAWLNAPPSSSPSAKSYRILAGYVYIVCVLKTNSLESWLPHLLLCDWYKFLHLF